MVKIIPLNRLITTRMQAMARGGKGKKANAKGNPHPPSSELIKIEQVQDSRKGVCHIKPEGKESQKSSRAIKSLSRKKVHSKLKDDDQ